MIFRDMEPFNIYATNKHDVYVSRRYITNMLILLRNKTGINPVDIFPAGMNVKGTSEEVIS